MVLLDGHCCLFYCIKEKGQNQRDGEYEFSRSSVQNHKSCNHLLTAETKPAHFKKSPKWFNIVPKDYLFFCRWKTFLFRPFVVREGYLDIKNFIAYWPKSRSRHSCVESLLCCIGCIPANRSTWTLQYSFQSFKGTIVHNYVQHYKLKRIYLNYW